MRCSCCGRRYRSKAAHEQAMRWKAVHDDLRLTAKISYSSTPAPDKHTRHAAASQAFRATGGT